MSDVDGLPEIDPAVYEESAYQPSTASRVAKLWRDECGPAPFTVVTMIAYAQENDDLRDFLLKVAPDRFGFGAISQNMLTRWFKSQEGASVPGTATRTTTLFLRPLGSCIWQYDKILLDEGGSEF